MNPRDTSLLNTQLALYFSERITRPDHMFAALQGNPVLEQALNEAPLTIPLPDDPELDDAPMVIAKGANGDKIEIRRKRIDYIRGTHGVTQFSAIQEDFLRIADAYVRAVSEYLTTNSRTINRVGFITRHFIRLDNPAEAMARFLSHQPSAILGGEGVHEVKVRFAVKEELAGVATLNIVDLSRINARIAGVGEGLDGVKIDRDFNTNIAGTERAFNHEQTMTIVRNGIERFRLSEIIECLTRPL